MGKQLSMHAKQNKTKSRYTMGSSALQALVPLTRLALVALICMAYITLHRFVLVERLRDGLH